MVVRFVSITMVMMSMAFRWKKNLDVDVLEVVIVDETMIIEITSVQSGIEMKNAQIDIKNVPIDIENAMIAENGLIDTERAEEIDDHVTDMVHVIDLEEIKIVVRMNCLSKIFMDVSKVFIFFSLSVILDKNV